MIRAVVFLLALVMALPARAGVEIKARQRETAENWCDTWQMPTRTEVDDMAKIVHELRREVRKLKREVATLKMANET